MDGGSRKNRPDIVAYECYIPYEQNGDGVIEGAWFNVVYHPMRNNDEIVTGMVAVCNDVSEQVRARRELEFANRRLEEFAYVASHDLQEPLRMVGVYTQLLLGGAQGNDSDTQMYAGFVREGVERMNQLIHDLLAYSRATQADDPRADLNDAFSQALKTIETRIAETNATVTAESLPPVRGETSQDAHVFQNLLSNSLKYLRKGVLR